MSVPNQTPYNIYTANGLTTVFPYEFYLLNAGDLAVSLNGSVITSGYTVSGVGNVDGGEVSFLTPPANGVTVMLERVIPTYRLTDYQDNGDLLADTVNKDFDRLWMAIQQAFIYWGLALTRPLLGGPFNAKGYRIENLADPANELDAVNKRSMKSYVEKMIAGVVGGFGWFVQWGWGAVARTFQDKMREQLTVLDFGADPTGGRESTLAFQQAIAAAIANGYKTVKVPSGTYLFKGGANGELNTGGFEYYGNAGILIDGEGIDNTKLIFDAQNADDALISVRGGSGTNTARGVKNLTIISKNGTAENPNKKGIGILLEGPCFAYVDNVNISFLNVGVKLHNNLAGQFTEFCRFRNMRIDRNNINIFYLTTLGDNSFHGNSWDNIQCQILDGGYGIRVISNNGGRAHIYNNSFNINFFGSTSGARSYAIGMTKCTCDYSMSNMTFEGDVYLQSTDDSWWHCWGVFSGYNGVLRYDCPVAPRLGVPASFIFDNASSASSTGNFTEPELSLCYPQILDMNWSNRALIGSYPGIIRTRSTSGFVNSLAFVNGEGDTSGFRFGSVADNSRLQGFKTKWVLNTLGTVLSAYNPAGTLYLNANNTTNSTLGRVFVSPSTFSPGSDSSMSCGNGAQKWTQVYAVNGSINTSDATHKTLPRQPTQSELDAFYEISNLPWVWQWLSKYAIEGDDARLHSGPTVQAAIEVIGRYGLDWTDYSCFCYDSWPEQEEVIRTWDATPAVYETVPARAAVVNDDGVTIEPEIPEHQVIVSDAVEAGSEIIQEYIPAGGVYSFRKDELALWMIRAVISKQISLADRVSKIESSIVHP
ncbi:phage tail fiber domain-containing protein [Serratia sp. TMDUHS_CL]|uniref:phage tail fiber domain-containing protein n=1 Tax=Serratia sp. TMDUHS_CL TaxID=3128862 RepID=UPI003018D4C3